MGLRLPAGKAEPKPVVHDAQVLEEAGAEEDEVKLVQQDERVLAYQVGPLLDTEYRAPANSGPVRCSGARASGESWARWSGA